MSSGNWACCVFDACTWTAAVGLQMKPVGKPDAGNPHVRFDERGRETGLNPVMGNFTCTLTLGALRGDRTGSRPAPGAERKLAGKEEALLVATACSNPPKGSKRWTLELLADEMVRLTEHEGLSRETIRRRLAENNLKP